MWLGNRVGSLVGFTGLGRIFTCQKELFQLTAQGDTLWIAQNIRDE